MTRAPQTIREIEHEILSGERLSSEVLLGLEGCGIRVRSNSELLIEQVRRYYSAFVTTVDRSRVVVTVVECDPVSFDLPLSVVPHNDPEKTPKDSFVDLRDGRFIKKMRTDMAFAITADERLAVGPCLENLNQVINFIDAQYIDEHVSRGGVLLHGSGVSRENCGLVLAGFSGMGKSTLSLQMLERGFDFISNDRVIVDCELPGTRMYGVAKQPRVNPGTILANSSLSDLLTDERAKELDALPAEKLWHLEEKYDVSIDEFFGEGRRRLLARLEGLVILNWHRSNERTKLERVDLAARADLLPAIMKPPGLYCWSTFGDPHPEPDASDYIQALADSPVYEVTGGIDFDWLGDRLESLIDIDRVRQVCM